MGTEVKEVHAFVYKYISVTCEYFDGLLDETGAHTDGMKPSRIACGKQL